ncbi:hypothetical protein CYLTODRAFT_379951 [Cylindrobasidium torrendii FP15055 ss-10]|uniref:RhoGAP-domain-containing protein n=1 Tax=Cylindrobasidium torrendii FP15055 ss-10 TaxID=1314674 RepID=A0A0D7B6B5_9AGAR|nr:hypothetical protein CYLTODRAFT_379951 [Cylindrobasidium torrendii FP15055 ss-10]
MAVLSLPLSFNNSFWSQDYRKGLEVLFNKLEQGSIENEELVAFVRTRIYAETQQANILANSQQIGLKGSGFGADDGASLFMAFRGLQNEANAQAQAHKAIASDLEGLVVKPFDEWAAGYKARLGQSRHAVLDTWMKAYEQNQGDVAKLKHTYLAKVRKADEAEDDAKFAPNSTGIADTYTTSPNMRPADTPRAPPQRTPSVSERIAARLKEIQKKSAATLSPSNSTTINGQDDAPALPPKVDKGKGKEVVDPAVSASPPPMSPPLPPPSQAGRGVSPMPPFPPPPMVVAGLSLPVSAISQLLNKAASDLNLRPIRVPVLGEYQDCFTGEEFVAWLNENVADLGGSLDRAEEAAKDLTEREGLLRRIGEFGNQFEHSDEAFYQFRPKAFDVEGHNNDTPASPIGGEGLFKRTNNFVSLVSKALAANDGHAPHLKARRDAEEADKAYRVAIRKLDRQRLSLEERLEETLKTLQRWELERLRAIKTVLLQYQGIIANLPKSLEPSTERSSTIISAYQPESDVIALIERYRTGPFRPDAQVYESVSHDESDVLFGIDLRKWAEGGWTLAASPEEPKKEDIIPPVLEALLKGVSEAYARLPDDIEKRKAWIYEVPLQAPHHLRETLNALPPSDPIPSELVAKYDAPVIASTIKLWLLELDPPIALYEGWDEFRKLYPIVGSNLKDEDEEQRIRDLGVTLQKLPRVHLFVLDAVVKHLKELIKSTTVEEEEEVYISKLALSLGRTIIRPKFETELSIQDRHPTLLFIDLIKNYEAILPPTIGRKKRESERKLPLRKRTALVDQRTSRSRLSVGSSAQMFGTSNPHKLLSPDIKQPVPLPAVPPPMPTAFSDGSPLSEVNELAEAPSAEPTPQPTPARSDEPRRPMFKEPSPETDEEDNNASRPPQFKEPPPEPESPHIPKFADPPPEDEETPSVGIVQAPPGQTPQSELPPVPPSLTTDLKRSDSTRSSRRSGSPTSAELETPKSAISRSSSGNTPVRGPRVAGVRGPRTGGGGSVSSMVSNINRNSISNGRSSPGPGSPPLSPRATHIKKQSASGGGSRPASVLGRNAAFRRTMNSDAEDDLLGKK